VSEAKDLLSSSLGLSRHPFSELGVLRFPSSVFSFQ